MTKLERLLRMYCEKGQEEALINDVLELKQYLGAFELRVLKKEYKDIPQTTNL